MVDVAAVLCIAEILTMTGVATYVALLPVLRTVRVISVTGIVALGQKSRSATLGSMRIARPAGK